MVNVEDKYELNEKFFRDRGINRMNNTTECYGVIKRLNEKGFGFIGPDNGNDDYFFHSSALKDTNFNELREGQRVRFKEGRGPKGPRAENVFINV